MGNFMKAIENIRGRMSFLLCQASSSLTGNKNAPMPAAIMVAIITRKPEEIALNKGMYLSMQFIATAIRTIIVTAPDFLA